MPNGVRPLPIILTSESLPRLADVLVAAERASLSVTTERFATPTTTYTYTRIVIGSVTVRAFEEPKWRDLGEGPSWQERYTLPMDVVVPLLWEPGAASPVTVTYPVTSLLRQGGAKWGGVSVAVNDERTPQPSKHTHRGYEYAAFGEIAQHRTVFGHAVRLAHGLTIRQTPYSHDPSMSHHVLDIGSDRRW